MTEILPFSDLLKVLAAIRLRKAKALCFFLANDLDTAHRSEKVIDLFWQDVEHDRAATSYRQVIRHIRRDIEAGSSINLKTELGQVVLTVSDRQAEKVSLRESCRQIILAEDWDAAAADQIRELLSYTTRLEGISGSYDSWLVITRSTLFAAIREALDERLANLGSAPTDSLQQPAEFALELEPSNEVAARILMTLDWQRGHATRAIERYDLLYSFLDAEFDQEPEVETIELLAAIKLNPAVQPARNSLKIRRPEVSIIVTLLPASGEIPDALQGFGTVLFADLRMRMGRFREWRVLDEDFTGDATVNVKLRPVFMADRYQLYVDVQRCEDRRILWSEAIDLPQTDWEAKARLLLSNLANALSVVVSDRSLSDSGLVIYDRWLRAQSLLDSWSPDKESAALAMLEDIVEEAPKFGPAHAELAGALNVRHILLPGTRQTDEVKQRALHHAIVAVSVDPLDTRAHRVVGWCYCHNRDFGLAEFHFDQSLNLNRSNPLTLASCALGFAFSGNQERAGELISEVKAHSAVMEPFHLIYIAMVDYLLGNYTLAVDEFRRGSGLLPTISRGWYSLALWKTGQQAEAVKSFATHLAEVRAGWHGNAVPSDSDIIDWFVTCFPLRDERAHDDFCDTTNAVFGASQTAF